ncbi:MAG: prolyl oligopeptidase family serine peptidase, partial [Saprospiraceae bacterium]
MVSFIQMDAYGQETNLKTLDHSDFLIWKTIQDQQISAYGDLVTYRLVPGEGDPQLWLHSLKDSSVQRFDRVSRSNMDYNGKFIYGITTPHRDTLREKERKKIDKKKWPADTLFIYQPETRITHRIAYATNYIAPAKYGDWIAYTVKKDAFPTDTTKEKKSKQDSVHLIVRELSTGQQDTLLNVKEFAWSEKAPVLMAIADVMDSTQVAGVYSLQNHKWTAVKRAKGEYSKLSLSPDGSKASFIANHDTTKALIPPFQLYYYTNTMDSAMAIAHMDSTTLPLVSQHADLQWSDDSRYLFYGRAEKPYVRDTTLLEDESVNVEIWSTDDPVLYTTQNVNKAADEKKSYLYMYDTQLKKHVPISSLTYDQSGMVKEKNSRYVLLYTDKPYLKSVAWLGDAAIDLAVLDLQTGKTTTIKKGLLTNPRLSPMAKYVYGYSKADSTWWAYHIETNKFSYLNTKRLPLFYDELNDIPGYPNNYGSAGWTKNDEAFILYDRYDLWKWSPLKSVVPEKLTNGRSSQLIHRYIRTDAESEFISATEPWLLHVTDDKTKSSGYTWYSPTTSNADAPVLEPYEYSQQVTKARLSDSYLFRKENFSVFPDLRITKDRFKTSSQISNANPQQQEYKWGTIELFKWMDWDSVERMGLLVKPYGFDTLRSSPLIVNFYERYTDALHHHPTIEPHRSTINYAFYASRGYAIFNPDIIYEIGLPGESAYKIVMSGVQALMKKRIADPENMALQGHSWGGYQIAFIVTRTDMFKCAEAGASVVNMTSAYGGIRWGTGLSRMFQYELAQSRIGRTLWEDPQRYISNSPLFKINKINTPLLLMHNDEDAAVPFEQGIEFYLALRRLDKKAWLLNYRGEPHWPVKWHNRKDFQMRMSQFFDHYLKG